MLKRLLAALVAFENNPEIHVMHVTEDCECFPFKNDANLHHTSKGHNQAPIEVKREEIEEAIELHSKKAADKVVNEGDKKVKLTKAEKLEAIAAATTLEELTAIEINNNESKEVKNALDAKLNALTA